MQSFRPLVDRRYQERRRLLDRLPDERGNVVWLEAPYGYGKSVLASQWAERLEQDGWRSVWLTARSGEPRTGLAAALGLPPTAPWEAVLDAAWSEPTLVVLEDLESLDGHESLTPLLRDVRGIVLMASRGRIVSSELPRLVTTGRLRHLGADDLAFSEQESASMFPDSDLARRLWTTTGGWPLPLHFASLTGDLPHGAALLEGMRSSLDEEEWEEALLLATVPELPKDAATRATRALARSGYVQLGDAGYRLHPLVAESMIAANPDAARAVLRREAGRLAPLTRGEAFERCGDLESLRGMFEDPRSQVYRQAPEAFLRWDGLLPGERSARRLVTLGGAHKVLRRHEECVANMEAALANGELGSSDELLALKDLAWSLAMTDVGRTGEALARGEELLGEVDPELAGRFLSDAAIVDLMAGRFDDAESRLKRSLEVLPRDNEYRIGTRINLALLRWDVRGDLDGRLAVQTETLDDVWRTYPSDGPGQTRDVAMMHEWMGDKDAAIAYLQRALTAPRTNPVTLLGAKAALAHLTGDASPFPGLMERAAVWGSEDALDLVAMYAISTLPPGSGVEQARDHFDKVPAPALAVAVYAPILATAGRSEEALALLDGAAGNPQRGYRLYLQAARYRVTRLAEDLDELLAMTNAGARVLPGLVPLGELPRDRPELASSYPIGEVLSSGWKAAVAHRLPDVPDLELTLLGGLELRRLGESVELTDRQRQILVLFVLGHGREEVSEAVWPEANRAKQRNNMGVQVSLLRKALEPWGVPTYVFEDGIRRLRSDHGELIAALDADDAATVLETYREPVAAGLTLAAIEDHRAWLRERVVACLRLAAEDSGQPNAERYLARVMDLDPLNEEALQLLLTRLVERGRTADAERRYREFEALLGREVGVEPLPETAAALRGRGSAV